MKLLHVLNELRPSGAETMLRSAGNRWRDAGYELHILSTGSTVGPYAPSLEAAGYKIHHIPFSKSPVFFLECWRLLKSTGWDVIHLHTERANFYLGVLACLSGARRVVRTIHSSFEYTGALRMRRGFQRRLLQRLGVRHVAISDGVGAIEKKRFDLQCTTIPNWFNSDHLRPPTGDERAAARSKLGVPGEKRILTLIGNCSAIKNHSVVLQALEALSGTGSWHLHHIGIEESGCPEQKLALSLGIADRVTFFGGQQDVREYLWASDLFLLPSSREGFGIALLEALACGTYSLASDVPGLASLAQRFDGLPLVGNTEKSWVSAISIAVQGSQSVQRELALGWAIQAKEKYSIDCGATAYQRLYQGEEQ